MTAAGRCTQNISIFTFSECKPTPTYPARVHPCVCVCVCLSIFCIRAHAQRPAHACLRFLWAVFLWSERSLVLQRTREREKRRSAGRGLRRSGAAGHKQRPTWWYVRAGGSHSGVQGVRKGNKTCKNPKTGLVWVSHKYSLHARAIILSHCTLINNISIFIKRKGEYYVHILHFINYIFYFDSISCWYFDSVEDQFHFISSLISYFTWSLKCISLKTNALRAVSWLKLNIPPHCTSLIRPDWETFR